MTPSHRSLSPASSPPLSPTLSQSDSLDAFSTIIKTVDVAGNNHPLPYAKDTTLVLHFSLYTLHLPSATESLSSIQEEEEEEEWAGEDGIVRVLVRDTRRQGGGRYEADLITKLSPQAGPSSPSTVQHAAGDGNGEPFKLRVGRGFIAKSLEGAAASMTPGEESRFVLRPDQTQGFAKLELALRQQHQDVHIQHVYMNSPQTSPTMDTRSLALPPTWLIPHHVLLDLETRPLELHIHLLSAELPSPSTMEPADLLALDTDKKKRYAHSYWQNGEKCLDKEDYENAIENFARALLTMDGDTAGASPTIVRFEDRIQMNRQQTRRISVGEVLAPSVVAPTEVVVEEEEEEVYAMDDWQLRNACRIGLGRCAYHLGEYRRCRAYCDLILDDDSWNESQDQQWQERRWTRGEAYRWRAKSRIEVGVELVEAQRDLNRARECGVAVGEEGRRLSVVETEEMQRMRDLFKGKWV